MHLLPFFIDNVYTCRPSPRPKRMQFSEIDLLMPFVVSQARNRLMHDPTFVYYQPRRSEIRKQDAKSEGAMDKDQFQVNLDVQHFSPEEITVKTSGDNTIIVEAKHEEKQDSHGHISRQFIRKYVLPKEHDINGVQSKLSSDGVLTITAPRIEENKTEARTIPIQHNDISSGSIEKEKETEDDRKLENEEK